MGNIYSTDCTEGWRDFLTKKIGHMACCAKLFKDPKSIIFLLNVAFWLGAGPLKILTVTLKGSKKMFTYYF